MDQLSAFDVPPFVGNAIALIAYYAVFLAAQLGLMIWFARRWNIAIFAGLSTALTFQILGSVAYFKLHFAPETGSWYSLWIVTLSIGPSIFSSSLHIATQAVLKRLDIAALSYGKIHLSRQQYLAVCLTIDCLALMLTTVGGAYVSAKASTSSAAGRPGFDVMVAAMAIQLLSLTLSLVVGFCAIISSKKMLNGSTLNNTKTQIFADEDVEQKHDIESRFLRPRLFLAVVIGIFITTILLFLWAVVRAVDLAGGVQGPLRLPLLVNIEQIVIFVAILLITALHPALFTQM